MNHSGGSVFRLATNKLRFPNAIQLESSIFVIAMDDETTYVLIFYTLSALKLTTQHLVLLPKNWSVKMLILSFLIGCAKNFIQSECFCLQLLRIIFVIKNWFNRLEWKISRLTSFLSVSVVKHGVKPIKNNIGPCHYATFRLSNNNAISFGCYWVANAHGPSHPTLGLQFIGTAFSKC